MKELRIQVTKDGDQWCALIGPDLQQGLAAFHASIPRALISLATFFGKVWPDEKLMDRYGIDADAERCVLVSYEQRHALDQAEIRRLLAEIARLDKQVKARNETLEILNLNRVEDQSIMDEQATRIHAMQGTIVTQAETIGRYQEEHKAWDQTVTILTRKVKDLQECLTVAEASVEYHKAMLDEALSAKERILDSRSRAERALRRAGFEDHGGDEWMPPVTQPQVCWALRLRFGIVVSANEIEDAIKALGLNYITGDTLAHAIERIQGDRQRLDKQLKAAQINQVDPTFVQSLTDKNDFLAGQNSRQKDEITRIAHELQRATAIIRGDAAQDAKLRRAVQRLRTLLAPGQSLNMPEPFKHIQEIEKILDDRARGDTFQKSERSSTVPGTKKPVPEGTNATVPTGESPSEPPQAQTPPIPLTAPILQAIERVMQAAQSLCTQIEHYYRDPTPYRKATVSNHADILLHRIGTLRLQWLREEKPCQMQGVLSSVQGGVSHLEGPDPDRFTCRSVLEDRWSGQQYPEDDDPQHQ